MIHPIRRANALQLIYAKLLSWGYFDFLWSGDERKPGLAGVEFEYHTSPVLEYILTFAVGFLPGAFGDYPVLEYIDFAAARHAVNRVNSGVFMGSDQSNYNFGGDLSTGLFIDVRLAALDASLQALEEAANNAK